MSQPSPKPPSNLRYAFALLPTEKRRAMHAVYAFCRYTDDLVDEDPGSIEAKTLALESWRNEIHAAYRNEATHPILVAMQEVVRRYPIEKSLLLALVDGVAMDLTKTRYQNWEELREYCYAVASVVGLISMEVFGYTNPDTKRYAIELGYALQLTNILRDVREDASRGRVYLPLDEIARFGCSVEELLEGIYSDRFAAVAEFEAGRARAFYASARTHLAPKDRSTMFPSRVMDATYSRLLRKMERARFRVFTHRFRVSPVQKAFYLMRYWLSALIRG